MLLTASEILRQRPFGWWFCLSGQIKREHIAAACLRQNPEVEVLCPRVRFQKQTSRGPVRFVESMFPGYLFTQFDYLAFHRSVKQGPGVKRIVQLGNRFDLLPHEPISGIKARAERVEVVEIDQGLEPRLNAKITQGPFQGFEGLVTRLLAVKDRVKILIEWMGRSLHGEVSVADLLPTNRAGPVANWSFSMSPPNKSEGAA